MTDLISTVTKDSVCTLTLDRAEKGNALNLKMLKDLKAAVLQASVNASVRVIVIKGKGKNFCSGADLTEMLGAAKPEEVFLALQELLESLTNCEKIILSVVQGACVGGGIGLLACSDLVLAEQDAFFKFSEVRLGLVPAVISPYAVRAIGSRACRQYFLTADKISATRAYELGLVSYLCSNSQMEAEEKRIVELLIQAEPKATIQAKKLLDYLENCSTNTVSKKDINKKLLEIISKLATSSEAKSLIGNLIKTTN